MSAQNHALESLRQAAWDMCHPSAETRRSIDEFDAIALDYANAIHEARISLLTEKLDEIGLRLEQRNDVHSLLLLDQILDVLDEVREHTALSEHSRLSQEIQPD